ncbi:hypothetical protein NRV47_001472 [Staphylococcus pseudintermedius]|nr:hypothetical protein [Staphylococcus pseudintermedius]
MVNKYLTLERKSLFKRNIIENLEFSSSSKELIYNIYEIDEKIENKKSQIVSLLHKLIGLENSKETRSYLLSLKKRIYNNKSIPQKLLNKKIILTINSSMIF